MMKRRNINRLVSTKTLNTLLIALLLLSSCKQHHADYGNPLIAPVDSSISLATVDSLLNRFDVVGAERCISILLYRDSNNCDVYYKLGRIQYYLDSLPQSQNALNKVIKLGCRKSDAYFWLGSIAKRERKYDDALLYLDSCINENHSDTLAIKERKKIIHLRDEEGAKNL